MATLVYRALRARVGYSALRRRRRFLGEGGLAFLVPDAG